MDLSEVKELAKETSKTAAQQILLAAARRIERQGWCQSQLKDRFGRVCLMGAIAEEVGLVGGSCFIPLPLEVGKLLNRELCKTKFSYEAAFNDAEGRTQEEVIAFLRRAAGER